VNGPRPRPAGRRLRRELSVDALVAASVFPDMVATFRRNGVSNPRDNLHTNRGCSDTNSPPNASDTAADSLTWSRTRRLPIGQHLLLHGCVAVETREQAHPTCRHGFHGHERFHRHLPCRGACVNPSTPRLLKAERAWCRRDRCLPGRFGGLSTNTHLAGALVRRQSGGPGIVRRPVRRAPSRPENGRADASLSGQTRRQSLTHTRSQPRSSTKSSTVCAPIGPLAARTSPTIVFNHRHVQNPQLFCAAAFEGRSHRARAQNACSEHRSPSRR